MNPVFLTRSAVDAGPAGAKRAAGLKYVALCEPEERADDKLFDPHEVRPRRVVPRQGERELPVGARRGPG